MLMFPFVVACLVADPTDCRMLTVGSILQPPFVFTLPASNAECEEILDGMVPYIEENYNVTIADAGCIESPMGEDL